MARYELALIWGALLASPAQAGQSVTAEYFNVIGVDRLPISIEMNPRHGHPVGDCVVPLDRRTSAETAGIALAACVPAPFTLTMESVNGRVELREEGLEASQLLDLVVEPSPGVRPLQDLASDLQAALRTFWIGGTVRVVAADERANPEVQVPPGPLRVRALLRGLSPVVGSADELTGTPASVVVWALLADEQNQALILRVLHARPPEQPSDWQLTARQEEAGLAWQPARVDVLLAVLEDLEARAASTASLEERAEHLRSIEAARRELELELARQVEPPR